jgi:hypothetical protein
MKAYVLLDKHGKFAIQRVNAKEDDTLAVYGLFHKQWIVLTGMTKANYKGKPFYYAEGSLGYGVGADAKKLSADEVKLKLDAIAQKRFWKYLGQRNLDTLEVLFMLAAGYGLGSWLIQAIELIFRKEGAA